MSKKITSPAEHRALLLESIECVLEGRINVSQANAVASISAEVHKSLKQEWDMRVYAAENLTYDKGRVTKMLSPSSSEND